MNKRWWTKEEDQKLSILIQQYGPKNWKLISSMMLTRSDVQCLHRWQKVLNPDLVKGPWKLEEDNILINLIQKHGPKNWSYIASQLPGRIGKQCRERWFNHLDPNVNKNKWTIEEDIIIIISHEILGNQWSIICKLVQGRTDNAIKNH